MLLLPITYISICIIKIILYIYYILAIHVIYHKRNNETLTTPPQKPFLHNGINNALSFGRVCKWNYNGRISTKLRVDIDRIYRTSIIPVPCALFKNTQFPSYNGKKRGWCYFAYKFAYLHAKLSTQTGRRVKHRQDKKKGYLKYTDVIEKISSFLVGWFCLFQLHVCWGNNQVVNTT